MGFERVAGAALVGVVLLAAASAASAGQQVVLVPNKDSTLIEAVNAEGSGTFIFIGTVGLIDNFSERRSLISFDIARSSIPTGATITGAELVLFLSKIPTGATASTITVHPMRVSWGEGPSSSNSGIGTGAVIGDSTWLDRFHLQVPWAAPGALAGTDYRASPSSFQTIDASDVAVDVSWSGPQMAADVEFWLDNPESNFGWIMIGSADGLSAKQFGSRESLVLDQRPELFVTYVVPEPSPIWAGLTAFASVVALRRRGGVLR